MKAFELYKLAKEHGGFTVNSNLESFNGSGYAVSKPDHETKVIVSALSFNMFKNLLDVYRDLAGDTAYIGCWNDSGKVYFDVSEIVQDLETAKELGKERKQLAIFDFETKQVISL